MNKAEALKALEIIYSGDAGDETVIEAYAQLSEELDRLYRLVGSDVLWPLPVRTMAEKVFGGGIHNPRGKTHKSLDRRIQHAMRVWRARYNGLTPEQAVYAGDIMAWAIQKGDSDAKATSDHKKWQYPYVLKRLEKILNDPRVHDAFVKRAGYTDHSSDVKEALDAVRS